MSRKELLEQMVAKEALLTGSVPSPDERTVERRSKDRPGFSARGFFGDLIGEDTIEKGGELLDSLHSLARKVEEMSGPDRQQQMVEDFWRRLWGKHKGTITGALSLAGIMAGMLLLSRMHRDRPVAARRDQVRRQSILDRGLFRSI